MKVGLGLPNFNQSLHEGRLLVDLARRAEALGFSSLATIGRNAYPTYEELVVLAAAAGATDRIGLMTDILLAPTREPILLARQAATLDSMSRGRFVLGIGVGARPEDYAVSSTDFGTRGKRLDTQLEIMQRAWRGELVRGAGVPVCPKPFNGRSVPVMIGGRATASVARVVKFGVGYTQGGGTPEGLKAMADRVIAAWELAEKAGRPQIRALVYFAIGQDVESEAQTNVSAYYGDYGRSVWANAVKSTDEARARIQAYEAAGCDELLMFMTAPGVPQAERLAASVL